MDELDIEFEFKPITSGLGFHQQKPQDIKPVFTEKALPTPVMTPMSTPIKPLNNPLRKEMPVYQNDLSIFYGGQQQVAPVIAEPVREEIEVKPLASASQRIVAYLLDLVLVGGILAGVLTVMARTIHMELLEVWAAFPHEITPLVLTLFAGFYLIYFSIFEKSASSTLGKNVLGLKVVKKDNETLSFNTLFFRTFITLLNFLTLGLFSWFDLQNKVTQSKVVRV